MDWVWIIVIILAVLLFQQYSQNNQTEEGKTGRSTYAGCYQRKYLLTKNEWYAYKKLQPLAASMGLVVCPKVRLLDILEPRKGEKDYKSLFWKIQAKHIDFLICDQDLHIKAIVELDDSSHERQDRKDRDTFVDEILQDVGYTVIRTKGITETTLDVLKPVPATTE